MRAALLMFPGINADSELSRSLMLAGAKVTPLWHTDRALPSGTDLVAIPGGFSYGDYLRAGAIARVGPIMEAVVAHAQRGGFVLGICNGFQILTECGLLPGALTRNAHLRFECRDVFVKAAAEGPFSPPVGTVLRIPVANGEGRYQAHPEVLEKLEAEGQVAFTYVDAAGKPSRDANPNGSMNDVAGLYGGPSKNVLGIMPHPERMTEACLGGTDGMHLFRAVVRASSAAA